MYGSAAAASFACVEMFQCTEHHARGVVEIDVEPGSTLALQSQVGAATLSLRRERGRETRFAQGSTARRPGDSELQNLVS